ncbi:MAG TPA: L(+)-tartrate dehydratase subunit beta [Pseudonocardiaceae bacterium]
MNKTLTTPISAADLEGIEVGDVLFLDGHIVTCRDVAHRRLVELGRQLPVDVRNGAILHAGPIIRTLDAEKDKFEVVSVGPTTSMRMEKFEDEFIAQTGVRLIVGKGGMGPRTEAGCREHGALHCVFPAGNAVIAATEVEEVENGYWRELGMPETMWVFRVKQFGPLIVSIDAHGNNLFEQKKVVYNQRKDKALEDLYTKVRYIK